MDRQIFRWIALFSLFVLPLVAQEEPRYDPLQDPDFLIEEPIGAPPAEVEETSFLTALANLLLVLVGLIALLLGAAYLVKKLRHQQFQGLNKTSEVMILERRSLSPKAALYLVEIKGERFLIGESPQGLVSFSKIDE